MAKKEPEPATPLPFQSAMERFPDHVKAFGMISIEMANLELFLGDLLGGLLGLSTELGQALYLTPRVAMGRLDIIENIAALRLPSGTPAAKRVDQMLKSARTIMGKRHKMTHGVWRTSGALAVALNIEPVWVAETPLTPGRFGEAMPLTRLQARVREIRNLIGDVRQVTWELRYRASPVPSPETSVERLQVVPVAKDNPRKGTRAPRRKSPPPPSPG